LDADLLGTQDFQFERLLGSEADGDQGCVQLCLGLIAASDGLGERPQGLGCRSIQREPLLAQGRFPPLGNFDAAK
jgi:hypothetical protein